MFATLCFFFFLNKFGLFSGNQVTFHSFSYYAATFSLQPVSDFTPIHEMCLCTYMSVPGSVCFSDIYVQ